MDNGRTDGRRLDAYTISSPCEPEGSGELITLSVTNTKNIAVVTKKIEQIGTPSQKMHVDWLTAFIVYVEWQVN